MQTDLILPDDYSSEEKLEIEKQFLELLDAFKARKNAKDVQLITDAFLLAANAHSKQRRKAGEPYIFHPLAVAKILAVEMGAGRTSVVSGLLHDVVEDTSYTLEDIRQRFGDKVATVVDGVTKLSNTDFSEGVDSIQAETMRKIITYMSDEMRVILVKLADRLNNMRTLAAMPHHKQLKTASETSFLYAPLAYRLGLYDVKTELEDLSLKYINPTIYESIAKQLNEIREERTQRLQIMTEPVVKELETRGLKARVLIVERSVSSIWERMKKYQQSVQEIYDTFVIRIIIDSPENDEKIDCWRTYAILTSFYRPNGQRLRDWISFPKSNGYESLHAIVMSNDGHWVEVQIRSERMNEIAEHGFTAYWTGPDKKKSHESGFDVWLDKIRNLVENEDSSAIDFLNNLKLDLFNDEIFVFTPQGKMVTLPKGATVLDFAYSIHSELGNHCIGANVNSQLVKPDQVLKMGEQVEIITSDFQIPQEKWYDFIVTSSAKSRLRNGIKEYRKTFRDKGKAMLRAIFDELDIEFTKKNRNTIVEQKHLQNRTDLYYLVAINKIQKQDVSYLFKPNSNISDTVLKYLTLGLYGNSAPKKEEVQNAADFTVASCCHPIPGDDVVAISFPNQPVQIHRPDCKEAIRLMSRYGDHIVKARWQFQGDFNFLATLEILSVDKMGLGTKLFNAITEDMKLNMQSIEMKTEGGMVSIRLSVYVSNLENLDNLIKRIKKIDLVKKVTRVENQ